jgi:hypothetical protein
MDYYQKYLKYKTKYLKLKEQLGGVMHPACSVLPKMNQKFPLLVGKDKTGFSYIDLQEDPTNPSNYKCYWCNNPTKGAWTISKESMINIYTVRNNAELLQFCSCS